MKQAQGDSFRELVGIAIGEASMCWTEIPKGVFESTRANALVDRICEAATAPSRKAELESLISGHIEAMRPLLNEWSEIK